MGTILNNSFPVLSSSGAKDAFEKNNIDIINKNFSMLSKIKIPNYYEIYKEPSLDDTSGPTTGSATYVDLGVAPLQINFSTVGGILGIDASVGIKTDVNGGIVSIILLMNGSQLANTERSAQPAATNYDCLATFWSGVVGAGTYSIKVQWKTSAATATAITRDRALRVRMWEP